MVKIPYLNLTRTFLRLELYRDLDAYVDVEVRKKQQLHLNFPKSHLITENRESIYSVKYDAFIGHHLFDYIASLLERFYGIPLKAIQDVCKEIFHQYYKGRYLKDTTFYYADEIFPNNKYKIMETNNPPKWR